MATVNLSGNFQPRLDEGGKSLPNQNNRVPSTDKVNNVSELSQITKQKLDRLQADTSQKTTSANSKLAEEEVTDQIKEFQQFNQNIERSLQFKVDEDLGVTIVRVIDKETNELVRQFPPEELINLTRRLKELNEDMTGANTGILIQKQV